MAEDAVIVFEPIAATTPEVRAEILSKVSGTVIALYQAGLISRESALAELKAQGREMGVFSRLKAQELQCTGCSPSSGVPSLGTALASVEPCSGTKALPALTLGTA